MPAVKVESLPWRLEDTLVQWLQGPYSFLGWKIFCSSGAKYITSLSRVMSSLLTTHMHYDYVHKSPHHHLDILIFRPVHGKRIKLPVTSLQPGMADKQLSIMNQLCDCFVFLYLNFIVVCCDRAAQCLLIRLCTITEGGGIQLIIYNLYNHH